MTKEICGDFTVLIADEGFLVTNGCVYGQMAYLCEGESEDNWYETEAVSDEY